MKRRELIKGLGAATVAMTTTSLFAGSYTEMAKDGDEIKRRGNINHSVSKWCYGSIPLEEFSDACKKIGVNSIELLQKDEWKLVKSKGMECAVGYATDWGIKKGFNRVENHDKLVADFTAMIPIAAADGIPNLICFSGNRDGLSDNDGLRNCAKGLKRIMPIAEKYGVTVIMELLNSKQNHKDYQCDRTEWGAALCEMVGSDRFKLLYDIYHMQVQEGDIISTIRKYHNYIGHYHTAGVPGRNELDDTQELNYPAIMKAIIDTGYTGYVGQEFVPSKKNKLASLEQSITVCDI